MYLLPIIYKSLHHVPWHPVISNYCTPSEKLSEFLDYHLQPIVKARKSYAKDSLQKLKNLDNITSNTILVTA